MSPSALEPKLGGIITREFHAGPNILLSGPGKPFDPQGNAGNTADRHLHHRISPGIYEKGPYQLYAAGLPGVLDNLVQPVLDFARTEDPGRKFEATQIQDDPLLFREYRSSIQPYPGALPSTPVVGPGGRIIMESSPSQTIISFVIRRRGKSYGARHVR